MLLNTGSIRDTYINSKGKPAQLRRTNRLRIQHQPLAAMEKKLCWESFQKQPLLDKGICCDEELAPN